MSSCLHSAGPSNLQDLQGQQANLPREGGPLGPHGGQQLSSAGWHLGMWPGCRYPPS